MFVFEVWPTCRPDTTAGVALSERAGLKYPGNDLGRFGKCVVQEKHRLREERRWPKHQQKLWKMDPPVTWPPTSSKSHPLFPSFFTQIFISTKKRYLGKARSRVNRGRRTRFRSPFQVLMRVSGAIPSSVWGGTLFQGKWAQKRSLFGLFSATRDDWRVRFRRGCSPSADSRPKKV